MREFVRPVCFVSSCIEFEHCRYDGGIIHSEFVKRLFEFIDVIRVCPEMSIGLGSPRDAVRQVKRKEEPLKLLSTNKGDDYTDAMTKFVHSYIEQIKDKEIDGFILKAKSPTCGLSQVKVYRDIGKSHVISARNRGFFGGPIEDAFPITPIETERRLSNYNIRNRFYTQLFTLAAFRKIKQNPKMKELVLFHANHKYLFMTYNERLLKEMGRIVASPNKADLFKTFNAYESCLRELLSKTPTMKKQINVLTHIYGYFKKDINGEEKEYYFDALDQYLNNQTTYLSVLMILKGWAIRFEQTYLKDQTIFEPYPKALNVMLDSGKRI